jgi:hypothetical protein
MSFIRRTLDRFRQSAETSRRAARSSSTSFRPSLESLEDRCVPTVDFYGGPVIPNVQVNTLFLGQQWEATSPNSLNSFQIGLNGFLKTIVNSPYMDALNQYGVGRGSFGWTDTEWFNNDSNMQNAMDDYHTTYRGGLTELQYLINNAIQGGHLPAPSNGNQLYVVYLPPGEQVENTQGYWNNAPYPNDFLGYHSSFRSNGNTIYYAVVLFPGGSNQYDDNLNTTDSLTTVTTHELAEAVTDPIVSKGWYDRNYGGEIGDVADDLGYRSVYWNGYYVQPVVNINDQVMLPPVSTPPPVPAPPSVPGAHVPSSSPPSSQPQAPSGLADEVAADALIVAQNVESGNINAAYAGLESFLYLYDLQANSPGMSQQQMMTTFIDDIFADL